MQAIQAFLSYPHDSYKKITQYFDDVYTQESNLPSYSGHKGTDYDAPLGTPIYAAASGKVIRAVDGNGDGCNRRVNDSGGFGNYVIIAHSNGYYTIYAHLHKGGVKVSQGDNVEYGQLIGEVGSSGRTYGSDACGTFEHLHFEVRSQRYGHQVNPYNLDTGCLFLGGCERPNLPTQQKEPKIDPDSGSYDLDQLGWLDVFSDINVPTRWLSAGSYDGGSRDGLHIAANSVDGDAYYHEVWWNTPERKNGRILDRLYKLDPPSKKQATAVASGNFAGGSDDILAVAYRGDDVIYFYHSQKLLGKLNPHPGRPAISNLATGDIDGDGKDELLVTVPHDDHVYVFDGWNGRALDKKIGFLDAHGGSPEISNIATMDIDNNGYDELLVATDVDDHIYEYYFDRGKLRKWWKFWQSLPQPFVKQGYLDCHGDLDTPQINPKITNIEVGKFSGGEDHLAVTTNVDDHIYFYWGRDLGRAWQGKILRQKEYKDVFSHTEKPVIDKMTVGDFDNSGDDELALAVARSDKIYFLGHPDNNEHIGYGGERQVFEAKYYSQSDKNIILRPGKSARLWAEFVNEGNTTWHKNSPISINLDLDSKNRNSIFYHKNWDDGDGVVAFAQEEIEPGEKARLYFTIKAPQYSGKYREYFELYRGNKVFSHTKFRLNITVDGEMPDKINNLRPGDNNADWYKNYTSNSIPSFAWDKAKDKLSGIKGYYLAIDDPTPDGSHKWDWELKNVTRWTSPEKLSDGWHTVAVTSIDKIGNVNPSNTNRLGDAPYFHFMVDTKAPSLPRDIKIIKADKIVRRSDGHSGDVISVRQPQFSWESSQDKHSGVEKYNISLFKSIKMIGQYTLEGSNKSSEEWRMPDLLQEGEYSLVIVSEDKAGNVSAKSSYNFEIDLSPPTISLLLNASKGFTNERKINLEAVVGDESFVSSISISNDGKSWQDIDVTKLSSKKFKYQADWILDSENGVKNVFVQAEDKLGNRSKSVARSIILDREKPKSWLNDLPNWHDTPSFLVSWWGQDHFSGISSYDVQYRDQENGRWLDWLKGSKLTKKIFSGLDGVTYWFRARSRDRADNQDNFPNEADTKVSIDTTKPSPPSIIKPKSGSYFNKSADKNDTVSGVQIDFSGVAEKDADIELRVGDQSYKGVVSSDGTWEIDDVTLSEGENNYQVIASDKSGNWNDSGEQNVWLDTKAPNIISDLEIFDHTYHSVTLEWTAPGDGSREMFAKLYDICFAKIPIDGDNISRSACVENPPVPQDPGSRQKLVIDKLEPKEKYYFVIKSADKVDNWSGLSNIISGATSSSASDIYFTSGDQVVVAEGEQKIELLAKITDPQGKSGEKLAGEEVSFIVENWENESVSGHLSKVKDHGDGIYSSVYTVPKKVSENKIKIVANCRGCLNKKEGSISIKTIPGKPRGVIDLDATPVIIPADGSSVVAIKSKPIIDKTGNIIANDELFTISSTEGNIIKADVYPSISGRQVFAKNGIVKFKVRADKWNGLGEAEKEAVIAVKSVAGSAKGDTKITFRDVLVPTKPIIITPKNNSHINDNTPTITGLAEPKSKVAIYQNDKHSGTIHTNSKGKFSYTINKKLSDGKYNYKVRAVDAAGNKSKYSDSATVFIDTLKPKILTKSPLGTIHHRDEQIIIKYKDGSGIDTQSTILKFNGQNVAADISSSAVSYQVVIPEKNKKHTVEAFIYDRAGNLSRVKWSFNSQLYTYLNSKVEPGYSSSVIANWPNSKGLVPRPNWWDPGFNDSSWLKRIFLANLAPTSVPRPNSNSQWLWGDGQVDKNETSLIRKTFFIPTGVTIDEAAIRLAADNEAWGFAGFLNGKYFGKVPEALSGGNPYVFGVKNSIHPGNNLLAIQVSNGADNRAGVAFSLTVKYHD